MRSSQFRLGRCTSVRLRSARMATMGLLLTHARLTGTTVLSILTAACLSAPVRGSTASMAAVFTGGPATGDGLDSAVLLRADLAADSVANAGSAAAISTAVVQSAVAVAFTAEAVVVFTVEEVSTAADPTAEAVGNR